MIIVMNTITKDVNVHLYFVTWSAWCEIKWFYRHFDCHFKMSASQIDTQKIHLV